MAQVGTSGSGSQSQQKAPVVDTNPFNKVREPWWIEKKSEPGVFFVDATHFGQIHKDAQGIDHVIGKMVNPNGTITDLKDRIKWDQPNPAENIKRFWEFGYEYGLWDKPAAGNEPRKLLLFRRPQPEEKKQGSGGGGFGGKSDGWRTVDATPIEMRPGVSIEEQVVKGGYLIPNNPVAYAVFDPSTNPPSVRHFLLGIKRKPKGN